MNTIYLDSSPVMVLDDDMIKLLQYDNSGKELNDTIAKAIVMAVNALLDRSKKALENGWVSQIRDKYDSMPTKDIDIANVIYAEPDYQDYDARNGKK